METVYLPGDEPEQNTITAAEAAPGATSLGEEIDLSPEARLARIQQIEGRLAAGEIVSLSEVNPKTHSPETVARVGQVARGRINSL